VKSSKGFRKGTRRKLKKTVREKFKPEKYIREFSIKDKVVIDPEPSSQKGMPHPRFKGIVGEIVGKRGRAYIINIEDGEKKKQIIAKPEHIKLV
jgi:large subunit ribosomal protein L21e